MGGKKTLVLGASPNPSRYSYKAIKRLRKYGHEVVAIAKREAVVDDVSIIKGMPRLTQVHTVTLYLGPSNQEEYLEYIISLKPKRIIFNPGTYNMQLEKMAEDAGIEIVEDCTLVMLDMEEF